MYLFLIIIVLGLCIELLYYLWVYVYYLVIQNVPGEPLPKCTKQSVIFSVTSDLTKTYHILFTVPFMF